MKPYHLFFLIIPFLTACPLNSDSTPRGPLERHIVIGHDQTDLDRIPDSAIAEAINSLHIAYNHTSHGSQLITGMNALENYPPFNDFYSWNNGTVEGSLDLRDGGIPGIPDLSQGDNIESNGYTPWVNDTREFLNSSDNMDINVVVWSWCSINNHDAQRYVDNMEVLISEYPEILFVFMTGHAEGQSEDITPNSVHYNNHLIRAHCEQNRRILYDFADIESYNPDGVYFWDRAMQDNLDYTGGNWAEEWISVNSLSELAKLTTGNGIDDYDGCSGTAHSDSPPEANLNGILKGQAAWWLWAVLAGWNG